MVQYTYMSGYESTEQDIEGVLRYLKIYRPEHANREFAVALLEYVSKNVHENLDKLADDPAKFEHVVSELEKSLGTKFD